MSETKSLSEQNPRPAWAVRTPDEMVNYFLEHEDSEAVPFGRNALAIKKAMHDIVDELKIRATEDLPDSELRPVKIYLPLEPGGTDRKVYKHEMSQQHVDLFDAAYGLTKAELRISELTDKTPNGRAWWAGEYVDGIKTYPMNFIEIHNSDEGGEYIKWQLVSDVPYDLVNPTPYVAPFHPEKLPEDEIIEFGRAVLADINQIREADFREAA